MPKIRFLILAWCLTLFPFAAEAQQANLSYLATQLSVTVSPASVFINTPVATQLSGRQSCLIQYRPVAGSVNPSATITSFGFVYFGPSTPSGTLTSFALEPFQTIACENANEVDADAIWVTSATTSDTFTIKVK